MLVGIVGKPNTGKSTFFSAITLIPVAIASRPFTTVRSNKGIAYLRTPCVCKEVGVEDTPINSACIDNTRLIPVEVIDCAGLIPGAWKGRGLGNQFLDEVRKADALIHIVDAAGATDEEGRICKPGTRDPVDDIKFLEYEIAMWLAQIIKKDWSRISRRVEMMKEGLVDLITSKLSGLAIKREDIILTLKRLDFEIEKPTKWSEEDILRFSSELRRVSKPILVAANKIDLPCAEENIERLRDLGYPVIPCSAEAELALRKASEKKLIAYKPSDQNFNILKQELMTDNQKRGLEIINLKILDKWHSTGVQEVLNTAFFKILQMITVYPVEDPERLSNHKGQVLPDVYLVPLGTTVKRLAYRIHTDLGESFIYAINARTKKRVGEEYALKDRDIIKIFSAKNRS